MLGKSNTTSYGWQNSPFEKVCCCFQRVGEAATKPPGSKPPEAEKPNDLRNHPISPPNHQTTKPPIHPTAHPPNHPTTWGKRKPSVDLNSTPRTAPRPRWRRGWGAPRASTARWARSWRRLADLWRAPGSGGRRGAGEGGGGRVRLGVGGGVDVGPRRFASICRKRNMLCFIFPVDFKGNLLGIIAFFQRA